MQVYRNTGSVLVTWVAETGVDEKSRATLLDIIDTPISPELIPADENGNIKQKTEDLVGPYELHDFFLFHFLRFGSRPAKIFYLAEIAFRDVYDKETIKKWLVNFCRRFFNQQFKRSCLPDGPKVGFCFFKSRGDWRMRAMLVQHCGYRNVNSYNDIEENDMPEATVWFLACHFTF